MTDVPQDAAEKIGRTPPDSHRCNARMSIAITREAIDVSPLLAFVTRPACGAEVLFTGTTRQWTGDLETSELEYEAYESMAIDEMEALANDAFAAYPIEAVAMIHRIGRVPIEQVSVAIAVGAAHRGPAFDAARQLIDRLKEQVPIWKRETFAAGAEKWIHPS